MSSTNEKCIDSEDEILFPANMFKSKITIDDDFDLEKIKKSGQCFRAVSNSEGVYRFISGEHVLFIQKAADSSYKISCTKSEWKKFWHDYFDLSRSYSSIRSNSKGVNNYIDEAINYGKGLRILQQDAWEMLITFIISQRKSMPAIASSVEALCKKFGQPITCMPRGFKNLANSPASPEVYSFPSPEKIAAASEEDLRACSLGYRAPYVLKTAQLVASGEINLSELSKLDTDQLHEHLKCAPGVGDKVANCVSLFGFSRLDRVPVDVWISRVIEEKCNGENPFLKFGEHAGIMQQYAFYYMTQQKDM